MHKVDVNGLEFYTIDRIEDIQKQMLRLLRIVDTICKDNGLRYFLDGGSAIGAYRHGGFIPWDDDLDICMIKQDYLRLVSELKKMDRSKFFLFDYDLNLHYASYFGEKVNLFCSPDNKKRHIYPIKIDIIPLNVIGNTEESLQENRMLRELSNLLFFGYCDNQYENIVKELFRNKFESNKSKFMSFYNLEYGIRDEHGDIMLSRPAMTFSTPKVYRYKDMFPLKSVQFSGMETYVPATDVWLNDIYGDYMSFPKVKDRRPEAEKVFNARWTAPLYRYLIDKTEKNKYRMLKFSLEATLLCR